MSHLLIVFILLASLAAFWLIRERDACERAGGAFLGFECARADFDGDGILGGLD